MASMPKFKLTTPVEVGDLSNRVLVDELEVSALSFQFDPVLAGLPTPQMSVSIVLTHRASTYKMNVLYQGSIDGAAALAWFNTNWAQQLVTSVLTKLIADGKLPAGTIA